MQYHKAAILGSERSREAQMKLFNYTGFAMLTYTIKKTDKGFEPVGEETLAGSMIRGNEILLFICDDDGYAKAQSKPLNLEEGRKVIQRMLQDGLKEFKGTIKTVS
jgi:hypothetical protein